MIVILTCERRNLSFGSRAFRTSAHILQSQTLSSFRVLDVI